MSALHARASAKARNWGKAKQAHGFAVRHRLKSVASTMNSVTFTHESRWLPE